MIEINTYHVYPVNEEDMHDLETVSAVLDGFSNDVPPYSKCMCSPKFKKENEIWICIHNSFDGREGLEWVNEILNQ